MKKIKTVSVLLLALISFCSLSVVSYLLFKNNLLPVKMRMVAIIIMLFIQILLVIIYKKSSKVLAAIACLLLIMYTGTMVFASNTLIKSFSSLDKIIDDNKDVKTKVEAKIVNKSEPFSVYISGIDTFGSLDKVSRSDVNLIATINPKTRQMLITTTPRDSYVSIADGGNDQYDKLTHAGIYGVESSVHTLENLYGIDINYYARVNFSSIKEIVDALGDITVKNDQSFQSDISDHYYPQGEIKLNGEEALFFARERHNLVNGDNDRGKHHILLIEGVIDKVSSPEILFNYQKLLDIAEKDVDTNMPKDTIIHLINEELEKPSEWDIHSVDAKGEGKMGLPSYAMPNNNLYMYELYPSSIESIKEKMQKVLNGEILTEDVTSADSYE